jgi:hypothetical protein
MDEGRGHVGNSMAFLVKLKKVDLMTSKKHDIRSKVRSSTT